MRHVDPDDDARPGLYRDFTAELFRLACAATRLDSKSLSARLREELGRRSLSRQTLAAWRSGAQAVPAEALWAAMRLGGTGSVQLTAQAVVTNPEFLRALQSDLDVDRIVRQIVAVGALMQANPPGGEHE